MDNKCDGCLCKSCSDNIEISKSMEREGCVNCILCENSENFSNNCKTHNPVSFFLTETIDDSIMNESCRECGCNKCSRCSRCVDTCFNKKQQPIKKCIKGMCKNEF